MIAFKYKIVDSPILKELELQEEAFILMTIPRSDTMDCEEELIEVKDNSKGIFVEPVDNFSFQKFVKKSEFAITEKITTSKRTPLSKKSITLCWDLILASFYRYIGNEYSGSH